MQISKNFRMAEFSVSSRYPQLANGVPLQFQGAIKALVLNVLQPICDATGWRCRINSGYRNASLNKAVGGAATSQHTKGEAADCVFTNNGVRVPTIDVLRKVKDLRLPFDQMIAYPSFVHFSHTKSRKNREQVLYNVSYKGSRI